MTGFGHTTPLQGSPPESARRSFQGRVIAGKYQLVRLIGEGGMGAVYEARHATTHKRCAVKLLISPELAAHPEIVKRFFREAKASGIAESDHIVQIFDSGSDPADGLPYMVMELLQGQDLETLLKSVGALEPSAAVRLVLQAATGLARAHERGIVHRDIKPANLFLTSREDGEVVLKLLDFGIAKVKMENFADTSQGLTKSGSMLGTPLYMSPEQARGKKDVDARTDVWSLGVVLYVALTGELPYTADTLGDLLVSIITSDIPLLQDRAPWVPPEIAEVVHRAMHRDLEKRYASAAELRDALAALLPNGARIHGAELTSVSPAVRQAVAPRLAVSEDGLLRAGTRAGLSVTQDPGPTAAPSRAPLVGLALGAAALMALAVVGGVKLFGAKRSETAAAPASERAPASTPPAPEVRPVAAAQTYELEIAPDTAAVTVDGNPAVVKDGKVELRGTLGETRTVTVSAGGKSREQVVALAQGGLVPTRIDLGASVKPPEPPTASRPAKPEPSATAVADKPKDKKPPVVAPTDKPKPPVETSLDEFKK